MLTLAVTKAANGPAGFPSFEDLSRTAAIYTTSAQSRNGADCPYQEAERGSGMTQCISMSLHLMYIDLLFLVEVSSLFENLLDLQLFRDAVSQTRFSFIASWFSDWGILLAIGAYPIVSTQRSHLVKTCVEAS